MKLNFFSFFNEILQNRLLIIAKLGATFSAIDGILANLLARYEEESERRGERERELLFVHSLFEQLRIKV